MELGHRYWIGDALVDAGAHRLEHHRRIELRHDKQHSCGWVLPLQEGQRGRELLLTAQIQHQQVGLLCAPMRQSRERLARKRNATRPGLAEQLRELRIGTDKIDIQRHPVFLIARDTGPTERPITAQAQ
jgi:hypothetical protein